MEAVTLIQMATFGCAAFKLSPYSQAWMEGTLLSLLCQEAVYSI